MKITGIYIVAPSVLKTGEEFTLKFKILTEPYIVDWSCWIKPPNLAGPYNLSPRGIRYLDNVYSGDIKAVEVDLDGRKIRFDEFHGIFQGDKRRFGTISGLRFDTSGIKFVKIRYPQAGIEATSNPIMVKDKIDYKIYWGDPHSQTFFSDGLRCPEELYTFARDEAFLDFFSVSDHSEYITDRQWEYFCSVANDFNENGRFVTLIAQEWTDHKIGHRNIYYSRDYGPILRAGIDGIEKVYEVAHKHKALVIPHHSANVRMGVNWNLGHDAEVEKLVEIYSVWGNSEISKEQGNTRPITVLGGEKHGQHVVDALNMNYKFGFVAGGDIHDGRPGDELHSLQEKVESYKNLYRQGITAVYAKNLTRRDIFDALWERKCYATSNIKPVLNFSINGVDSGSTISEPKKLYFSISGASEVPFRKIFVISGGKVYREFSIEGNYFEQEFENNYSGEQYFYVRVQRVDGEMAWLTPIWIER